MCPDPNLSRMKKKFNIKRTHPEDGGNRRFEKKGDKPGNKRRNARSRKDERQPKETPPSRKSALLSSDEEVRLNRYIANAGICSRREADALISEGLIKVNGKVADQMGIKVKRGDRVTYKGELINPEKPVYVLLNKPKDFVTTMSDPQGRKTVMDLIKRTGTERIYPVGRLDRATTGVLLITNDGDLTKKLTHPSHNIKKVYHVHLSEDVSASHLDELLKGVELEDGLAQADRVHWVDESDKRQVGISLHSGKNRIVRRMFDHLGYKVVRLDRVMFAGLTKKDVPRGKWRYLSEKEVGILKRMSSK